MRKLRAYLKKIPLLFTSTGEMTRAESAGNAHIGLSCTSLSEGEEKERDLCDVECLLGNQASGWCSERGWFWSQDGLGSSPGSTTS